MTTINEHRGEFEIELEGVTYGMRPSYEAVVAIEKATGMSLLGLAQAAASRTLSVDMAASIVTECVKAWGRAVDDKAAPHFNARRVGELLLDEGILLVVEQLKMMLYVTVTGGVSSSGERKMPATMATTEPTPASASPASQEPRSGGRRKSGGKARR